MSEIAEVRQKLKDDLLRFTSIVECSPFPIWLRDEHLHISYCNTSYREIVGNATNAEGLVPELDERAGAVARAAYETGEARSGRVHVVAGGNRHLYRITEVPIIGSGHMVGYAVDMDELEKAEEEIRLHVAAQADLLESSTSAMAIFGADTRLKHYNNAFVNLWRLDERWLDFKPTYGEILEMLRENRRLPEQTNFQAFKKSQLKLFTGLIETHEEFFFLPDGTSLRVIVIPHALGGLLFDYEDVTDRLALERSYNTLNAVQRATLDNLYEGVAVFGEDGRLKLSNPVYARMWGFNPEYLATEPHVSDLIEQSKGLYVFDGSWDEFRVQRIAAITTQNKVSMRLERSDNVVYDLRSVPLPDGATLVTYLDVTDSTLLERSLREKNQGLFEAERLKTEFLANVSYELRSPLTTILGFADIVLQEMAGPLTPRQQEYLEGIRKSSTELKELIDDVLDVAGIEAGYIRLEPSSFDVADMLTAALSFTQARVRQKQLDVSIRCPRDIGVMTADEKRMKQVMFNLLSNAMKFTPEGGNIVVGAEALPGDEMRLWVADTGMGIPEQVQDKVFERFYQTTSARGQKSGPGLGLTLVKNIVMLHSGRVHLSSKEGQGTTVEVVLPRMQAEVGN